MADIRDISPKEISDFFEQRGFEANEAVLVACYWISTMASENGIPFEGILEILKSTYEDVTDESGSSRKDN